MKKEMILALFAVLFLSFVFAQDFSVCGDMTFEGTCSLIKPYYCENKILVEKASVCGCEEGFQKSEDSCVSKYHNERKIVNLTYFFKGEERQLSFPVYKEVNDYMSNLSRVVTFYGDEEISKSDFKLHALDDEIQRQFLLPLIVKIQNLTEDPSEQVRIAVSLVQSIHYQSSNQTEIFLGNEINHSRYPYEVVYENKGVCGEKTQLLAFLLKEIGYGTSLFYYEEENHEALGVKCPKDKSKFNSGYCFIETTGRAIINDDSLIYENNVVLNSLPKIFILSKGKSLPENIPEYKDSKVMEKIRNAEFMFFRNWRLNKLREKYGLFGEYYLG